MATCWERWVTHFGCIIRLSRDIQKVISTSDNEIHIADKQFLTAILPEKAAQFSLESLSEMAYTYSTLESSATEAFIGQVKASLIEPLQHAGWPSPKPRYYIKRTPEMKLSQRCKTVSKPIKRMKTSMPCAYLALTRHLKHLNKLSPLTATTL